MRWLLALVVLLAGCGPVVPAPVVIREPRPEPLALTVGVHYPDELRSVRVVPRTFLNNGKVTRNDLEALVGQASVKLLDEALGLLFARVVPMPTVTPVGGAPGDLAAIIEPTIQNVEIHIEPNRNTAFTGRASITYGFALYTGVGDRLATWTVSGIGLERVEVGAFGPIRSGTGDQSDLELAMRDAAWNFMRGFREVPDVRRWLEERGVR
jgi:hypothetical protein